MTQLAVSKEKVLKKTEYFLMNGVCPLFPVLPNKSCILIDKINVQSKVENIQIMFNGFHRLFHGFLRQR